MDISRQLNRVAVTGMGVVTPIGCSCDEFGQSLHLGRSGIATLTDRDCDRYHSCVAALCDEFHANRSQELAGARWLDRATLMALDAFFQAIEDSELDLIGGVPKNSALVLGTTLGGMNSGLKFYADLVRRNLLRIAKLRDFSPYSANDHIMACGSLNGTSLVLSSACAASSHAIGTAVDMIRSGRSEVAITGGFDTFNDLTFCGFGVLGLLSKDTVKPFDQHRSGLVLGEGAGIIILESFEHAHRRGAKILGEVLGFGMTSDAFHMTSPESDGAGAVRAMQAALKDADLRPKSIGYINAHGTATKKNDSIELTAMLQVFGRERLANIPVSSTKSMIGHTLGAAGALEFIATLLSLNAGYIHPTIGTSELESGVDIDIVANTSQYATVKYAMTNSFGFGGNNGSLVLGTAHSDQGVNLYKSAKI